MACAANELISFLNTCEGDQQVGGVNKRIWALEKDKLTLTTNVGGEVDTVTITTTSPVTLLKTFTGKQYTHNGTEALEVNTNVNTFKQDFNLVLNAYSQLQITSIESLCNSAESVYFIETNSGLIKCWGFDFGLKASASQDSTGTALADSTATTVTVSGSQKTKAKVCNFGATLADNITYLDALAGL
jgi:hypothetical protein